MSPDSSAPGVTLWRSFRRLCTDLPPHPASSTRASGDPTALFRPIDVSQMRVYRASLIGPTSFSCMLDFTRRGSGAFLARSGSWGEQCMFQDPSAFSQFITSRHELFAATQTTITPEQAAKRLRECADDHYSQRLKCWKTSTGV